MLYDAVDLFAGPGGWDHAALSLGIRTLGFENDRDTVWTRHELNLPTMYGDVRSHEPDESLYESAPGLIASPPCQSFSRAGKGAGRARLDDVTFALNDMLAGAKVVSFDDPNTGLVLEPMRWILSRHGNDNPFQWIAMEQVPSVLPVWEAYAEALFCMGYAVHTEVISAEEYGVPQTRKRAILLARYQRGFVAPKPTHQKYVYGKPADPHHPTLQPWVSIREALGVDELPVNNQSGTEFDLDWQLDQPAQVVAGRPLIPFRGANANRFNGSTKSRNDGFKVTLEQMAWLQTFPPNVQWQGGKTSAAKQIGNAIPPLLAHRLLQSVAT